MVRLPHPSLTLKIICNASPPLLQLVVSKAACRAVDAASLKIPIGWSGAAPKLAMREPKPGAEG
jgi:hypothetical protein